MLFAFLQVHVLNRVSVKAYEVADLPSNMRATFIGGGKQRLPAPGRAAARATLSSLPEIVLPPPAARMLVASSAVGAHPITRAIHNGGQVQPIGRPFAGTVLLESGRTALEEPERANAVSPGGVGEPDADLGETLPKVSFLGRPGFPSGLKYLMCGERPPSFHQAPGRDQCLCRRQRLLRDRLHARASVWQRPPKSVTWPGLPRAP
jgi:hypothetical protein